MYAKEFSMNLSTIAEEVKAGKLFALYDTKTMHRDINLIRAGLTPPKQEIKSSKNKRVDFRMKVASLIDENPFDYVGIYNADGNLIGHEYAGKLSLKEQETEELLEEVKNENQLQLNF